MVATAHRMALRLVHLTYTYDIHLQSNLCMVASLRSLFALPRAPRRSHPLLAKRTPPDSLPTAFRLWFLAAHTRHKMPTCQSTSTFFPPEPEWEAQLVGIQC